MQIAIQHNRIVDMFVHQKVATLSKVTPIGIVPIDSKEELFYGATLRMWMNHYPFTGGFLLNNWSQVSPLPGERERWTCGSYIIVVKDV